MIRPRALQTGDRVAIAAPTDAMHSRRLRAAIDWLESRGFEVRVAPDVTRERQFTRADDELRARTLERLAADPSVRAILCARGGYGTARVLRFLDPEPFRANAPLVVGYSEITLLLAWLAARANLVSLHGPVAWSLERGMDRETEESLARALTCTVPWGLLGAEYTEVVVPGRAAGPLVGGNLTMVAHTLGTPYEVRADRAILFLEDTSGYEDSEEDIEQALLHLKLSGLLDRARGFVIGELSDDEYFAESLLETFLDLVGTDRPVLTGFPAGHVHPNLALPIGVRCEIDTARATGLRVLEGPLVAPPEERTVRAAAH